MTDRIMVVRGLAAPEELVALVAECCMAGCTVWVLGCMVWVAGCMVWVLGCTVWVADCMGLAMGE
jgi:hypothetical protein